MAFQLSKLGSFRHGVHPSEHKDLTEHIATARMPFVDRYILPLSQHLGGPAKAVVSKGERVVRGQVLAEPSGFVSAYIHSPVTGKVADIGMRRHPNGALVQALELEIDPYSSQRMLQKAPIDPSSLDIKQFIGEVQKAGLVGMGGAAFPTHVKYSLPEGKRCRYLVINGSECEPYLTTDHRTMVERPEAVMRGIEILLDKLGPDLVVVGVESNKPDAVKALRAVLPKGKPIEIRPLKVKYPQGAEKMLIKALFNLEVPAGKLPIDVGMVVNNVGTMAALADYFDRGIPLMERVVTVSGPGVTNPANLIVPVGTSVREVLEDRGGLGDQTRLVVLGGPMMGQPLSSLDVPVLKGSSGILAFTETDAARTNEYTCVKCGRCAEACAYFLNPSRLAKLARAERFEEAERLFALDCMECGACSYSCPSGIPIVQLVRVAKAEVRKAQAKRKAEEEAAKAAADQ